MPASTSSTTLQLAVGTPAASMTSLANALEPSSRAAAALGPNAAIPRAASSSARPATSGASGPMTTRSQPSYCAASASPAMSSTAIGSRRASAPMPGLPGAQSSSGWEAERFSARTSACSRPPAPTTRILGRSTTTVPVDVRHQRVVQAVERAGRATGAAGRTGAESTRGSRRCASSRSALRSCARHGTSRVAVRGGLRSPRGRPRRLGHGPASPRHGRSVYADGALRSPR